MILHSLQLYRPLLHFQVFGENFFFCGFESGDTELFQLDPTKLKLMRVAHEKSTEHEDELLCVETCSKTNLAASGSRDGIVKIWDTGKGLVRELKFQEPIFALCFINNDFDLLVAHGKQVSLVQAVCRLFFYLMPAEEIAEREDKEASHRVLAAELCDELML